VVFTAEWGTQTIGPDASASCRLKPLKNIIKVPGQARERPIRPFKCPLPHVSECHEAALLKRKRLACFVAQKAKFR
jgi:hypothetical protein